MGMKKQRRNKKKVKAKRDRAKKTKDKKKVSKTSGGTGKTSKKKSSDGPRKNKKQDQSTPSTQKKQDSAPKTRQQKMKDAARARNENFKKTGVQTHGGTRKNYSKAEARKIQEAGLNFRKVTGGAKNPLARAPVNPDIQMGELMPQAEGLLSGLDYSGFAPMGTVDYNFKPGDNVGAFNNSLGVNRLVDSSGFTPNSRVNYNYDRRDKSQDVNMRDLFQAKDLGNMTTNAINRLLNTDIPPASMSDRDAQSYLGYNPNKPGRYLSSTDRPKANLLGGAAFRQAEAAPTEPTAPEETPEETGGPIIEDPTIIGGGGGESLIGNGSENVAGPAVSSPIGGTGGMAALSIGAGNRGNKRFQYGMRSGRGAKQLGRDSMRFQSRRLPTNTTINI